MEVTFDLASTSELMKVVPLNDKQFGYYLWVFREGKNGISTKGIYYHNLKRLLELLGYRKITSIKKIVLKRDGLITETNAIDIKNHLFQLIVQMDEKINIPEYEPPILSSELAEVFLRSINNQVSESNGILDYISELEEEILRDTKSTAYVPYQNGVAKITKSEIKLIDYSDLKGRLVWSDKILLRNFKAVDYSSSTFQKFIFNICDGNQERVQTLRSIIGYNLHRYNPESESRACYNLDGKSKSSVDPMGGTGKGLVAYAIGCIVVVQIIDGKRFKSDSSFLFQEISPTADVIHLDDVKANFDPDSLNSILSSGLVIERKGKQPIRLAKTDSPKFIISSNSGVQSGGTTRQRRQVFFTFGSYYSDLTEKGIKEPIKHTHGHNFFGEEWTDHDWEMFDSFMLESLQLFLQKGIVELKDDTVKWINLRSKSSLEFCEFVKSIEMEKVHDTKSTYSDFMSQYGFSEKEMTQRKFSNQLSNYAKLFGLQYVSESKNGNSTFSIKN